MSRLSAIAVATVIRSILVNALLAAVKIVAGVVGNSYALIADGIESLNDVVASVVVLVSLRISSKPPDEDHPYGHGKAEQLGALFSALSLLAAGGTIAWQSIGNLSTRHHSPEWFTLPVLVIVIITKERLSRHTLAKSDETSSAALKGDAWHHRSDAITSAAAFVGIAISLVCGPGYEKADDIAALIGCGFIAFNGFALLRDAVHETMDGAPPAELSSRILGTAGNVPGVLLVEKLRMKKIGLGYFMDLHVQVDRHLTVEEGHRISHRVKDAICDSLPAVNDVIIHIEPFRGKPAAARPVLRLPTPEIRA